MKDRIPCNSINVQCPRTFVPHSRNVSTLPKRSDEPTHPKNKHNSTGNVNTLTSKQLRLPTGEDDNKVSLRTHDGIANISDHKLSTAKILLLKKGLSFVPTPLKTSSINYERSLKKTENRYKNRFSLPTRSDRLIDCSFEALRYDLCCLRVLQPIQNITKAERKALYRLKKNKDIVISKADKCDTTVIMNTSHFVELAHQHLSNSNTYQLLTEDPTQEVVVRFNQYILDCKMRGVISQQELERLLLPDNTSTQTMYFLPKFHKNPLKLRPIIACTNGPTRTASAFLDKLLQPNMKNTKFYFKNSMHLINILSNNKIPINAYLITLDIESLYTNISRDQAIIKFTKIFNDHPQLVFLVDLLKFVLKNNIFEFDMLTFTHTCGLAIGTKLTPALATIYIGQLEEAFLSDRAIKPDLCVRYVDDIFLIWAHTLDEFDTFMAELNDVQERINFMSEISKENCNFLDLTIHKSPTLKKYGPPL